MQLGMAIPPEEMARRQQAAGPGLKDAIRQAVGHKATGKRPRGHQQCSQPVDAADLRRRLYMVQSQQERMKERRLLAMIEEATQRAAAEEEAEEEREKARQKQQQQQASNRTSWVPTIVRGTSNKAPESLGMIRASMRGASSSGDSNNSMSPLSRRTSTQTTQQQRARTGSNRTATSTGSGSGQQQQPFHYVPQEAALQFARTATPSQDILRRSNSRKVHELSVEALRLHTEDPALPVGDSGRALRKVQSEREKLRSRNQFQTGGAIEETKDDDDNITQLQQQRPAPSKRYTVPSESSKRFSLRWSLQHGDLLHPVRTGGSAAAADEHQLTRHESIQQIAHDHRMVDWTQSDEAEDKDGSGSGKRRSPLLKKADSLWGLKDRLGKRDASTTTSSGGDLAERVDAMVPKPVKRGIWTKLRRHAAAVHA